MPHRCLLATRCLVRLLGGVVLLGGPASPLVRGERGETVEFVEVIDGDSLRVRRAGRLEALRLSCVDCEEALHPAEFDARDKPQTVFGEETRLWLAAFLELELGPRRELELASDDREPERDGFGRLLAHVTLPDGRDLGLELVRRGRSPYFVKYGTCRRRDRDYRAAERTARARGRGIWSRATNRPAHTDAPVARRDYASLRPWWDARAEAVAGFRAAQARDPLGVVRGDDPDGLARASAAPSPPRLFVEVVSVQRGHEGSLSLRCAGDLLDVFVPAESVGEFAALDLARRNWTGHQNYLWVHARPERHGKAFRVRCTMEQELAP